MSFRRSVLGALLVGATTAGCLAVASPAWAVDNAVQACGLSADAPKPRGRSIEGKGYRNGCSDTVTYFWARIYKVIDNWPDSEIAVRGRQHVQNGDISVVGGCDGSDKYYTHTSTSTGLSGDSVESGRADLC